MSGITPLSGISSSSSLPFTPPLLREERISGIATATLITTTAALEEEEKTIGTRKRKRELSELSIKTIQELEKSVIHTLTSNHLDALSQEEFDSLLNTLNILPLENFREIFTSKKEEELAFALLSSLISDQLLLVLKTLPSNKIKSLFEKTSEKNLSLLFSKKFLDDMTFLDIACNCNNKDLMDLILSYVPEIMIKEVLSEGLDANSSFIYAVAENYDEVALSFIAYAKKTNNIYTLLNQEVEEDVNLMLYLFANEKSSLILSILESLDPKERYALMLVEVKENLNLVQYLFASEKTAFIASILNSLTPEERHALMLIEVEENIRFIQYLFASGKTSLITSILDSLDPKERQSFMFIEGEPVERQPLALALLNKQIDTFKQVLDLVPKSLFFTYPGEENLLHFLCLNDINEEVFDCINNHLIANKYNAEESWKNLLSQKDDVRNTPIENLVLKKRDLKKIVLMLKKIEIFLNKEDCVNFVFKPLICISLFRANFMLASHLILQNLELLSQVISKNQESLWLYLAQSHTLNSFQEGERVEFFKKHRVLYTDQQLKDQLNQIDKDGNTPLSFARLSNLKNLEELYIEKGADPVLTKSVNSTKALAQCCSIQGNLSVDHSSHYQLEGWNIPSSTKVFSESLKTLKVSFPISPDLLEVFEILTLPAEEQQKKMEERAKQDKIWIRPVLVGPSSTHVVSIIGISKLIFLCNTASSNIQKNGSMQPLIPLPEYSFRDLFSLNNNKYYSGRDLLSDLIRSYHLKILPFYETQSQKVGNCTYKSLEASLLAYLTLSKIQESVKEITEDSIGESISQVTSRSEEIRLALKWKNLERFREDADPRIVATIDSISLIQYANYSINNKQNSSNQSLIEEDSILSPLKPWDKLSEEERDLYINVSRTKERLILIKHLLKIGSPKFIKRLLDYISKKKLHSLIFEESPLPLSLSEK